MKTDKYWASNPKKNGSYVDKGRVEAAKFSGMSKVSQKNKELKLKKTV